MNLTNGSGLISLLIELIVFGVIIYVVNLIVGMLSLPPQVKTIVMILIGLIFLIVLLNTVGITHIAL